MKIVAFVVASRKHEAKKFLVDVITSAPMVSQDDLKKAEVSPSGPGALLGFNLKTFSRFLHLRGSIPYFASDLQGKCSLKARGTSQDEIRLEGGGSLSVQGQIENG